MRLDQIDERSPQSDERKPDQSEDRPSLMTPARRAALDALEEELRELLQGQAR